MIQLMLFCFFITTFCVMIIDASGLIEYIKRKLYYLRYTKDSVYEYYNIPIIECAKCTSYWATVIYLTINGVELHIALVVCSVYAITAILLRKSIIL